MRDVAAPLYRFFLADAQTAARDGDTPRALECLGLALDFAPEAQRERVLLAAAEIVPATAAAGAASGSGAPGVQPLPPLIVELAPGVGVSRSPGRIAWEQRVPPPAPVPEFSLGAEGVANGPQRVTAKDARSRSRAIVLMVGMLLVVGAAALRLGWLPTGASPALRGDPVQSAARALTVGDAAGVLRVLEPLGPKASPQVWLFRASAYEVLGDTQAAIGALTSAAARDADGGGWALEAGDRLGELGAIRDAAEAYLYAVTPLRTEEELERIASMQERAGYRDRAGRVRGR